MRTISCIFLLLTALFSAHGQLSEIEVESAQGTRLSVEPGGQVTAVFRVRNTAGSEREFVPLLDWPEDWKPIITPKPFSLKAGGFDILIVGFHIPSKTPANTYGADA